MFIRHNFVLSLVSEHQGSISIKQTPPSRGSQLIVIKAYVPQYFDEMELKEGDVVAFLNELEEGWWRGMKLGNPSPVRYLKLFLIFSFYLYFPLS